MNSAFISIAVCGSRAVFVEILENIAKFFYKSGIIIHFDGFDATFYTIFAQCGGFARPAQFILLGALRADFHAEICRY